MPYSRIQIRADRFVLRRYKQSDSFAVYYTLVCCVHVMFTILTQLVSVLTGHALTYGYAVF